ncbi:methylated-DNA--[protein]-cysteine S-methyltransferase [Rhodoferax sp. TBRC 17660]|uniref:Methylated-DNA--protein-cysteine methyltransferase n=1 Tax=Rhodoferax potami TaxID=3068338 RepID=A0ABU3KL58_9BURK|nr:methylated-DNA--[protein]-cysteine S-methyltransferase [Rhodoferax sp. TBRC 17660]MDT7517997.1 methylated-DNA--[protein]-cysteine S-methyltransferase [Rhodoferax sp. TBRC 17660]
MKIPTTARLSRWTSPLGPMLLAGHDAGLLGVWFEQQKHYPDVAGLAFGDHPAVTEAQAQLAAYFAGERTHFSMTLDASSGTAFQQSVWRALLDIPCGVTISYSTLSQQIGRPSAVRAVAAAVGRNPLSIVVPCHRVLGSNGSLTGYAGGVDRKAALLNLEQRKP